VRAEHDGETAGGGDAGEGIGGEGGGGSLAFLSSLFPPPPPPPPSSSPPLWVDRVPFPDDARLARLGPAVTRGTSGRFDAPITTAIHAHKREREE